MATVWQRSDGDFFLRKNLKCYHHDICLNDVVRLRKYDSQTFPFLELLIPPPNMKQSQLSFTTSKRIAGNLNGKGGKPKPTPAQLTSDSRRSSFERPIEVQDDSRSEDETETHARGDAEYNAVKKEETVAAVTKPSTKTSKTFRKLSEETKTTKIQQDPPKIDVTGLPDLNVKDKRWNGIYKEAKEAMGGQKPSMSFILLAASQTNTNCHCVVHGKDDDRIVEILRIFDL